MPANGNKPTSASRAAPHIEADLPNGASPEPVGASNRLHLVIVTPTPAGPCPTFSWTASFAKAPAPRPRPFKPRASACVTSFTSDPEFLFKFEAEGYAPFVTRTVKADESGVSFDVPMRAATATQVTVLLPSGKPAAFASVGLVFPGAYLALVRGGIAASRWGSSSGALLFTDVQGQFQLPSDDTITRVWRRQLHPHNASCLA